MMRGTSLCLILGFLAAVTCSSPLRRSLVIVCAGDSLTEQGYPRFLKRILRDNGFNARVLNYGRSGSTSAEYLKFLDQKKLAMEADHPDAILLSLGTNDVRLDGDRTGTPEFRRNLERIIAILRGFRDRRGKPTLLLLATVPPIPEIVRFPFGPESRKRIENEINPVIRQLVLDNNLPLADNYALFLVSPQLLPGVHPTDEGYKLMAENWFRTLGKVLK